jgi:fatty acid desaturase
MGPMSFSMMTQGQNASGEEFRGEARKVLPREELLPLTQLSAWRSTFSICQTLAALIGVIGAAIYTDSLVAMGLAVILIAPLQHGLFILVHEAAHYRLFETRWLNDLVGRLLGMAGGISMCTYRVIHRLHHNHLYGPNDPDVALHGGYPRGKTYLLKKLGKDLLGLTAYKNYGYFFGNPAINTDSDTTLKPLHDTSPHLRRAARQDRWVVAAFHLAMPVAMFAVGWGWYYLVLWVLPLATGLQMILRLRAICEHGAVIDTVSPLLSARTNHANAVLRFFLFPHHVNYHLDHHLYPAVPHYRLPALHEALREKGVLEGAEVRRWPETLGRIFAAPFRANLIKP